MKTLNRIGQLIFALAIFAFGGICIAYSDFVVGIEPIPTAILFKPFLVYLTAAILITAGFCIAANFQAVLGAIASGTLFLLWIILLHIPRLISRPRDGGEWTVLFETLALFGFSCAIAGSLWKPVMNGRMSQVKSRNLTVMGQISFAISLPVFGILHFIYYAYVASVIPAWIPWHLFWAYFIGVLFVFAGLSVIAKVQARLTSILVGAMFGIWVLILHAPRVVRNPLSKDEWTSMVIAFAMWGGSWIVAANIPLRGKTTD